MFPIVTNITTKIAYALSMVTLLLALIIMLYISYLMFYPFQVIVAKQQPYPVVQKTVKRGEQMIYIADYCKYLDAEAAVERTLVDSVIVHLPAASTNLPMGCRKAHVVVDIPKDVIPGTYYFNISLSYHVNFFRTIIKHFKTEEFTITE